LLAASESDFTTDERAALNKFFLPDAIIIADKPDWLQRVCQAVGESSIPLHTPPTVRATVWDQPKQTIVHLLNLNIQRLSSFEDRVVPVEDLHLKIRVRSGKIRSCRALTPDSDGTAGALK